MFQDEEKRVLYFSMPNTLAVGIVNTFFNNKKSCHLSLQDWSFKNKIKNNFRRE